MRGTGSIPRLNLLLLTGPMRRVTLIWMAVPRSFEHLAGERLEPEKDDTSKMCGDRSASWDLTHIRGRLVATNADVVRGNSRLMPNRHCVSCTVDACLLLVIGVPVKSPFLQVHLEVAGTVFRQRRLSEYGRLNSISHQSGCLLYDCLA